jgi:hypothetical protein
MRQRSEDCIITVIMISLQMYDATIGYVCTYNKTTKLTKVDRYGDNDNNDI